MRPVVLAELFNPCDAAEANEPGARVGVIEVAKSVLDFGKHGPFMRAGRTRVKAEFTDTVMERCHLRLSSIPGF